MKKQIKNVGFGGTGFMEGLFKIIAFLIGLCCIIGGAIALINHFKKDKKSSEKVTFTEDDKNMILLIKELAEIYRQKDSYYDNY